MVTLSFLKMGLRVVRNVKSALVGVTLVLRKNKITINRR